MTVNYSFELEDDDFFVETFRNVSETELCSTHIANTLSKDISTKHEPSTSSEEAKYKANENKTAEASSLVYSQELDIGKHEFQPIIHENMYNSSSSLKNPETDEKCEIFNSDPSSERTLSINSRFTPGFTPKAKKRKFPGPAGFVSVQEENPLCSAESNHIAKKQSDTAIDIQNITCSQFSADDLLLASWQKLQADVSSSHNLLSTAKYYSIQRVYHETSKKKLPKHIVVPVLCVLLKKFNHVESPSVFIDDTGEVSGKINEEVLNMFEEYLRDGVALILKNVAFLCNVLLLTEQCIVSIYLGDGTVKHIQDINSVPKKEELLKPLSCKCTGTVKSIENKVTSKSLCISPTLSNHNYSTCDYPNQSTSVDPKHLKNSFSKFSISSKLSFLNNSKRTPSTSDSVRNFNHTKYLPSASFERKSSMGISSNISDIQNNFVSNSLKSVVLKSSPVLNAIHNAPDNSKSQDKGRDTDNNSSVDASFEENDLFGENTEMDEFDELLCDLDESSFLEEIDHF